MAMLIGVTLSPAATAAAPRGAAPPPEEPAEEHAGARVAVEPFLRDRVVFDSGAALGRDEARIRVEGTATPGLAVEARAVPDEGPEEGPGAGAPTPWTRIATAGPDGRWSGEIAAPRRAGWLRPEARLAEAPATRARGTRFGVGHVIAIWGQSEVDLMLYTHGQDLAGHEALLDEDAVQILWHSRRDAEAGAPGVRHHFVTSADPRTGAVSALANALIAERPGEKFCVVFQVEQGTSFTSLVSDADDGGPSARRWADDAALHAAATPHGGHVGVAAVSWFAAPRRHKLGYEAALFPLFTGRDADGTPVAIPGTHRYRSYNVDWEIRLDHWFGELYDPARTRWAPYGPHRFEPVATRDHPGPYRDANHHGDGAISYVTSQIEDCRRSWRAMVENPHAGGLFLPIAVEPLNYRNGERGAEGWRDLTHPSADTPDGLMQFGRLTAHAALRSAGLTSWPIPEFDRCAWDPAGAFVEVWSSAGPVTTTRRARGLAPPATPPGGRPAHWTDAVGFQIDGRPATRAEITAEGRVRLHPAEGAFTGATRLGYGEGGATGQLDTALDHDAELWMDVPIVDVGAARVDGIAVRPLPDPAVLESTVTGAGGGPAAFFTREGQDASLRDPARLGPGVDAITAELTMRLRAGPGYRPVFELSDQRLKLEADTRPQSRKFRVYVRDGAGLRIGGATTAEGAFELDAWVTIRLVALRDRGDGTGSVRVFVDDRPVFPRADAPATGEMTSPGAFEAGRRLLAAHGGTPFDAARVRIWKEARGDGGVPEGAPHLVVEGDAAAANAHPWKWGADDFT